MFFWLLSNVWKWLMMLCQLAGRVWTVILTFDGSMTTVAAIKNFSPGAPGWFSQLSLRHRLKSWSHGLWVWAPHWALCGQHRARFRSSVPLPLPGSHECSLSKKKTNKNKQTKPSPASCCSWHGGREWSYSVHSSSVQCQETFLVCHHHHHHHHHNYDCFRI